MYSTYFAKHAFLGNIGECNHLEIATLRLHLGSAGPPTGGGGGEQLGHFAPGPSLKGAPGGPMKGPLNTCLKDRYTLIEQSDLNTLIE